MFFISWLIPQIDEDYLSRLYTMHVTGVRYWTATESKISASLSK